MGPLVDTENKIWKLRRVSGGEIDCFMIVLARTSDEAIELAKVHAVLKHYPDSWLSKPRVYLEPGQVGEPTIEPVLEIVQVNPTVRGVIAWAEV